MTETVSVALSSKGLAWEEWEPGTWEGWEASLAMPYAQEQDDGPRCAALRQKADALLGQYGDLAEALARRSDADSAARQMLLTAAVRELRDQFARLALKERYDAVTEAQADDAPVPSRRRRAPRHASSGPRPLHAVGQAAAAATATAAVATVITLGGSPAGYITHAATAVPPAAAAHARLAPAAAVPFTAPAYRPRHAGTEATSARHAAGKHRMLSAPIPPPSPAASPSPVSVPVAAGVLQVAQVGVVITGGRGQLAFAASGGPVTWSAVSSSPWVSLSATSGTLAAGEQAIVTVMIQPGAPAAGTAVITLDGRTFPVTWALPLGA